MDLRFSRWQRGTHTRRRVHVKCTFSIWIGDIASIVIVCLAGLLNYSIPLGLTEYLVHETDYLPWRSAYNSFISLEALMASEPDYYLLRVLVVFICKFTILYSQLCSLCSVLYRQARFNVNESIVPELHATTNYQHIQ